MNRIIFERRLAEKNINQRQMAEEIGMRPQRVTDILSGRLKGWKYRRRISQYLGVAEETLFPDDGEQSSCQPQNQ